MSRGKIFHILSLALVFILMNSTVSDAAILLSDDFTGTTINTLKWNETDAGGVGGITGNIQQNGSLSITGSGSWGANYLVTDDIYDRSLGGLEMEADVTCGDIFGIGYGDPGVLSGGGESYTVYAVSNTVYFSRQLSNSNAENITTAFTCTTGVPFHIRIAIGTTTGAALYINGSGTAAGTVTGGTFNNKGFFLSGFNGSATLVDNFVVNGVSAATVPGAPTGLTATSASTQMGLTWTAPASNGGAVITDYLVEYKLASEPTTWTTFSDGTSTTAATTVTGLTNGLSYNFRVSAINSVGASTPSSTATATPVLSAPSAPQSLAATSGVSGQSALTWSAPVTNGGAAITDYIVQFKLNSEPTTWTTFSDGTSASTGATVTGLVNGSTYNFRVAAVNSVGTGVVSSTANATPNLYSLSDNFTGTTIDTDKWVEVDAGGSGGTTGNVQQNNILSTTGNNAWGSNMLQTVKTYTRVDGDVTASVDVTLADCASSAMAFSFGGHLTSNSTYFAYHYGGALNFAGFSPGETGVVSPSFTCTNGVPFNLKLIVLQAGGIKLYVNNVLSGTISTGSYSGTFALQGFIGTATWDNFYVIEPIIGPESPSGLSATPGDGQVALSWTAGADNGAAITDYLVEYKLSTSGSWSTFSDGVSASTSATVTGLANGLNYNFRVSGINSNGTSSPSSTTTARPVSATPTAPTATGVTINGNAAVGEQLTGTYTFVDVNGNTESGSTYRWLSAASAGGSYTAISGAISNTYIVVEGDVGRYLKFEVTPHTSVAPTTGSAVLSSATSQVATINYLNMILSTGQSLSVGVAASPSLSTSQPYSNKMLSGGYSGQGTVAPFIPLIESGEETMSSGLANSLTFNDPGNDLDTVIGLHGLSGATYAQLKKGTGPYSNGMTQVTNAKAAATALSRVLRVIGVTNIHGETDNFNGVSGATYQGYLEEWQNDYDTDVKAITGQSNEVYMFLDQMSSFMSSYANDATSEIPIYQLKAAEDNPGKIVLVAPKYFFNYSDRHHLTAASSRWLGEYHAKVIKKVAIDHQSWRPLTPDSAVRSGNIINVDFHVPAGVLAFDTTLVSARTNKGFEYYDSTSSATITSVSILDSDTVQITLSGTPSGSNQRIRYAYTGVPGTDTGAQNAGSAAGNLRDTDPYPSLYGNTLYNWAVHFDEPITVDNTAPSISSVSATPTSTSATITWNTNEASSSIVDYGLLTSYGNSTIEADTSTRVSSHSVSVSGLLACTTYHYRVRSKDALLNTGTGTDNTFTTTGCTGSASIEAQGDIEVGTSMGRSISLLTSGNGITLDIPASAVTGNTLFQVKKLNAATVLVITSVPSGYQSAGTYVYDLKALTGVGTGISSFPADLTISIRYDSADIVGLTESGLMIYSWDGSTWSPLTGCVVDTIANTITCTTTHFSVFSLFGIATQAVSSPSRSGGGRALIAQTVSTFVASPKKKFTRNLKLGIKGEEVKLLQQFLNTHGFIISSKGAGSPGKETTTFGPATKLALKKFQKKYGIPQTGNMGPLTRAKVESL